MRFLADRHGPARHDWLAAECANTGTRGEGFRDQWAPVRRFDRPTAPCINHPAAEGEQSRAHESRLHPVPSEPVEAEIPAAGGRGRRALPCVRAGGGVSVRAEAQIHAVRRAEGETVRAARLPRLRQERDRAGDLPRHRQPRAGRCADELRTAGPRASPSSARRSPTRN